MRRKKRKEIKLLPSSFPRLLWHHVLFSVRGKLLNKLSSLHRLVKNLEPTGDLMKQYQEFILTPKREHDAIKDEEMTKEGV
jgi:hypothetical protein